jgi:hypothetical protein
MTTLAPPPTPSSAERAQGRAHPWRALAVSFLLGVSFVACTLTESDVQPPPIDSINPVQPGGDDEPPASRCQVDADCDSNRTCVASACRLAACLGSADVPRCELELCPAGACMADTCNDRQRNGNETDIDCGGGCLTCALAASCAVDVDCQSGSCAAGVCVEASCSDGRKNGGEAAVDCGGNCPLGCASGATCRDDADCSSRRCAAGVCVPAGCNDGQRNQDESDTDCGGTRCGPCPTGGTCAGDGDCAGGLFCTSARECASTTCADGSLNGGEILTDCGGGECPGCPSGTACSQGDDCQSDVCSGGVCASASCSDGTLNQDESDADCGGAVCEPCLDGLACDSDEDCESAVCGSASCDAAVPTCCQAPSCSDGVINGNEVVTDCGNAPCPLCADGHPCTQAAQCQSGSCADGVCSTLPACDDGAQNGSETDEDCGGSNACARCGDGDSCNAGSDCASGQCAGGVCISCSDGRQNGNETDIDCGGACGDCGPGLRCGSGADCQSGACAALNGVNRCCGGSGQHCTRCAEQLSANVDCSGAADPTGVGNCNAFLQCLANNSAICTTRNAAGCSGDPGGVCNHNSFGGDFGTGVSRANQVLTAAGCQL